MRRTNKVTLYELMQPKQSPGEPRTAPSREAPARTLRVPVGFMYIGAAVLLILVIGFYALGYQRGGSAVRSEWELDRVDSARIEQHMQAIAEVDEPGGATSAELVQSEPIRTTTTELKRPILPVRTSPADPRQAGWNYYVIDHPSAPKAQELVQFCRDHGLEAYNIPTSKGDPKVFVLPGYQAGGSSAPAIETLRKRIREVGVLWQRLDPRHNSDFSTRYG